ncbi:MAG TPA: hypothetical protein PLH72_12135 [Vicinamibacterales bacterium]|nr:hypothetical protein [Vicinamibacterales bacterium]
MHLPKARIRYRDGAGFTILVSHFRAWMAVTLNLLPGCCCSRSASASARVLQQPLAPAVMDGLTRSSVFV